MLAIPDLLLMNANVITLDPFMPKAGWVALGDGKIIRTGNPDQLTLSEFTGAEIIDCRMKTLLPGFIDSHLHLLSFAESLVTLNLKPDNGIYSLSDIQSMIYRRSREVPPGTWIRGKGYNEFYLAEKRHPNRWDLDEVSPNHPVKLTHRSGHAHVLNSLALKLTGITMETQEPAGGIMERDLKSGVPNGLLYEMGDFLSKRIPPLDDRELEKGIQMADQKLISFGITTIQDASFQNDRERWRLYKSFKDKGIVRPRLHMMLGVGSFKENEFENFMTYRKPDHLKGNGIKILLDETTGQLYPSQSEIDEFIFRIHKSGMQAAIHAIEEKAVDSACLSIEKTLERIPGPDHRHRIEHCSVCPPSLVRKISELGIIVVSQPGFIYDSGDRYLTTVESGQIKHLYPFGSLVKAGIRVAAGSDCPFGPLNPLIAISTAISRKTGSGRRVAQSEGIQAVDGLKMYTEHGAYCTFSEDKKGSITAGKFGDLILLSEDPLKVPPEGIKDIKVEMTIIDGDIVWDGRN